MSASPVNGTAVPQAKAEHAASAGGDDVPTPCEGEVHAQPLVPALERTVSTGAITLYLAAANVVELPLSVTISEDGCSSDHLLSMLGAGGRMHVPFPEAVLREWLAARHCVLAAEVWADGLLAEGSAPPRVESMAKCLRVRSPLAMRRCSLRPL